MQDKLLVVLGPTATGKSALAVSLALKFNGEVISADSRQVYCRMDIGTGKITHDEMRGVKHHLLDVAEPDENFSVATYQELARAAITDIQSLGKLPILCGGTGLYIKAITQNSSLPKVPPNFELREELETWDTADMVVELEKLDPNRAENIDKNNRRRLVRAIEIARAIGEVPELIESSAYDTLYIGLQVHGPILKKRIHDRLIARMDARMIEEVESLHTSGVSWKKLESFGLEYKYVSLFLQHTLNREQMIIKLESEIWQYAKRQMTWFKKYAPDTKWFNPEDREEIEEIVSHWVSLSPNS
ncbi:MAG: tRNA (adenosine(37)-N6)-dimethylallyltransferase MiaA [Candidatus Paceibacterota bacterium]|jgi:tRNA dimethylallyltransferase